MVPVRLCIKGFKSYREPQVYDFSGSTLWALSGPNGAGKSSAFDAIYFVLFGPVSPGIPSDVRLEDLTHHGENGFSVEFDMAVGGQHYRVIRSKTRSGSAYQVLHLPGGVPVPETESKEGFDAWVTREIGLSKETFTRSVYLRQNHAVELVEGKPTERYEVLREVVDLRQYESIHARAKDGASDALAALKAADADATETRQSAVQDLGLEGDPGPADIRRALRKAIETNATEAYQCADALGVLQERRDTLGETKVLATAWQGRNADIAEHNAERAALSDLLGQADQIRDAVARDADLEQAASALSALRDRHVEAVSARSALTAAETQRANVEADLASTLSALDACRDAHAAASCEIERLDEDRTATAVDAVFTDLLRALDEWEALDRQRKDAASHAETYPATLDDELRQARAALGRSQAAERDLPHLQAVSNRRRELAAAAAILDSDPATKVEAERATAQEALATAEHRFVDAVRAREAATDRCTAAATQASAARDALAAFQDASDGPDCRLCGQRLTPNHIEAHQSDLEAALSEAQRVLQGAEAEVAARRQDETDARAVRDHADREFDRTAGQEQETRAQVADATATIQRALPQLALAHNALTPAAASSVAKVAPTDPDAWLSTVYPSAADLDNVQAEADHAEAREVRVQHLANQVAARDLLTMKAEDAYSSAYEVARENDLDAARTLRPVQRSAQARLLELDAQIVASKKQRADLEAQLDTARASHNDALEAVSQSRERLATATSESALTEQSLVAAHEALPTLAAAHEGEPEAGLLAVHAERQSVSPLIHLADSLDVATARTAVIDAELDSLHRQQSATPDGARRPVADVAAEIEAADTERRRLATSKATADAHRNRRQPLLDRLQHLQAKRADTAAEHRRYKRLADLTGREGLQRALVRSAEIAIADHAGALLDQLTGGRLELRLRSQAETSGKDKALDLVALDRDTGGRELPVSSLSGSQKFRVAVALALAIGRYASEAGRPIRAVIIDEGFGGLDADGLDAMADALHDLEAVLDRVLLVSHQPDFSAHFPNRYTVTLEGGASVARRAVV